jgi:CRISPR/Cas system-associated protein endoribonuclease Cas2
MEHTNPVDQAICSNLTVMEMFLQDMIDCVQKAQESLTNKNRNGAIGALLCTETQFADLKALFDATMVMHRNAPLVEGPEL